MKRALMISLAVIISLILGWFVMRSLAMLPFKHRFMTITIDPIFSEPIRNRLDRWCRTYFDHRNVPLWAKHMREQHQLIARVICEKQDYDTVNIIIIAKPIRFITDHATAIDLDGTSYPITVIDTAYRTIPCIHVNQNEMRNAAFKVFSHMVPDWLLYHYDIDWHSAHAIWLNDHTTHIPILVQAARLPSKQLLTVAQHLVTHVNNKKKAYADVRFADQIVVALKSDLRGEGDVKGFS